MEDTSTSGFAISMASYIRKAPRQSIAGIGTAQTSVAAGRSGNDRERRSTEPTIKAHT